MTHFLIVAPIKFVGDTVMMHALVQKIASDNQGAKIDVLALKYLHPLLKRMPEIAEIIDAPFRSGELALGKRYRLAKKLRDHHYDHGYVAVNNFKAALVLWWAKIKKRTGWLGEMRYLLLNDIYYGRTKLLREVDRFAALAFPKGGYDPQKLPFPKLRTTADTVAKTLANLHIELPFKPILVLCHGPAHRPAKRWPPEFFAEVALTFLQQGWAVWLLGSKDEVLTGEAIMRITDGQCLDLTGRTTLEDSIDLLSQAKVVVSSDSGLMHVAAAVNCAVVALYGATPAEFAPPLCQHRRILASGASCKPCRAKITCTLPGHPCMRALVPDMVVRAVTELAAEIS